MTYVKIDSIFHEINQLSNLIQDPQRIIEEVINIGYESSDDSWIDNELLDALRKMRFASFISTTAVSEQASHTLLNSYSYGQDYEETLTALLAEKVIDRKQYKALRRWV